MRVYFPCTVLISQNLTRPLLPIGGWPIQNSANSTKPISWQISKLFWHGAARSSPPTRDDHCESYATLPLRNPFPFLSWPWNSWRKGEKCEARWKGGETEGFLSGAGSVAPASDPPKLGVVSGDAESEEFGELSGDGLCWIGRFFESASLQLGEVVLWGSERSGQCMENMLSLRQESFGFHSIR